jgi:hypothetical protein
VKRASTSGWCLISPAKQARGAPEDVMILLYFRVEFYDYAIGAELE